LTQIWRNKVVGLNLLNQPAKIEAGHFR